MLELSAFWYESNSSSVESAIWTGAVRKLWLMAMWAFGNGWSNSFIVSTSLSASRFRMSTFWIWHIFSFSRQILPPSGHLIITYKLLLFFPDIIRLNLFSRTQTDPYGTITRLTIQVRTARSAQSRAVFLA